MAGATHGLLLDRGGELAAVEAAIAHASGGGGRLLLLHGAAGTGKSALVGEARARVGAAEVQVLTARSGELERDFPFGVMRQLCEPLLARATRSERAHLLAGAADPAGRALGVTNGHGATYAAGFTVMHAIYWLTVATRPRRRRSSWSRALV